MVAVALKAEERDLLGKKVKKLRREGLLPAHVYGKNLKTEHVSVSLPEFLKVFASTGETGLIDLKIGAEKVRPVLVRGVQIDPVGQTPLHIDFYQVNLKEKVTVPVPIILEGEEPELVHSGEAVVIQPLNQVEVEALPTEIPEHIVVSIEPLKAIGDAIYIASLQVPKGVTLLADPEAVVVKLDTAVTEEMQRLLEEQQAEVAAAAETAAAEGAAEGEGQPGGAEAEVAGAEEAVSSRGGEGGEDQVSNEGESTQEKPQ